jgi:TrmH family RNA methyltransferase
MPEAREIIKSRSNLFVRRLHKLIRNGREEGLVVVEGVRLAEEALAARLSIVEAAATPEMARHERGRRLIEEITARRATLRWLDPSVLASLSDVETSQGVLLLARRPDLRASLVSGERPLALILAGVQDPGNLGSLLRTAEAAGVTGVFVGSGCADPFAPKALRGAMGSTFRLPVGFRPAVATEIATLRHSGVAVWAAAAEGKAYDAIDWRKPTALVVGNEGAGLPDALVNACNGRVSVPMGGRVESLNVAVAAGIILFEAARQRRAAR